MSDDASDAQAVVIVVPGIAIPVIVKIDVNTMESANLQIRCVLFRTRVFSFCVKSASSTISTVMESIFSFTNLPRLTKYTTSTRYTTTEESSKSLP